MRWRMRQESVCSSMAEIQWEQGCMQRVTVNVGRHQWLHFIENEPKEEPVEEPRGFDGFVEKRRTYWWVWRTPRAWTLTYVARRDVGYLDFLKCDHRGRATVGFTNSHNSSLQVYFTVNFDSDGQKVLEFQAENEADCEAWVSAISQCRWAC